LEQNKETNSTERETYPFCKLFGNEEGFIVFISLSPLVAVAIIILIDIDIYVSRRNNVLSTLTDCCNDVGKIA